MLASAPVFEPNAPQHRPDPHPLLHRMRELDPVHRRLSGFSGVAHWYLTRYADVQAALHHPDLGRQLDRLPPQIAAVHRRWNFDPLASLRRTVFHLDPPDHTRLRRLMAPAFSARTVTAIDRHLRAAVDDLLTVVGAAPGPVDLIAVLALPLPVLVIAELVGFPLDDLPRLRRWSDDICRGTDAARVHRAGREFAAYAGERIEEKRGGAGDDLLTRLIAAHGDDRLTRTELVSAVFQLLLAGDETTVNLIGNGVLELLRHPDQLARLRARPELIDSAVEEVMRYNGPVGHARHLYALSDVEIGGTVIRQGDVVIPVLLAANRDPAVFRSPDTFDIGRTPNRHLGFGHGLHFCLGAALARMQARVAIGALVARFPRLELAVPPSALDWTPDFFLHGVRRLPVLPHGPGEDRP